MQTSAANLLSLARVPLGIALLALYSDRNRTLFALSIGLIAIAVATDVLDGYLARRMKTVSETGYVLDGLGDRAIYVSIILTLVVTHSVALILAWILIFREVLIYALRVLSPRWYAANSGLRTFSRWHAAGLRIWIASYLLADGLALYVGITLGNQAWYQAVQWTLVTATIAISYYGLFLQAKACAAREDAYRAR